MHVLPHRVAPAPSGCLCPLGCPYFRVAPAPWFALATQVAPAPHVALSRVVNPVARPWVAGYDIATRRGCIL